MANILSTNKYVIIPGKKSFVYYFDTTNNQFYIPWEQYETSKKLGIDIEGKPKIIQGRNCYSIHPEQLKELQGKVDLVAGGPPCQGFSMAGKRVKDDVRNQLVFSYIKFIKLVQPKMILFENVKGFTYAFNKRKKEGVEPYSQIVINALEGLGYAVKPHVIDFSEYGVPQRRKRFILVGVKDGLCSPNKFEQLLKENRDAFLAERGIRTTVTLQEAISDLLRSNGELPTPDRKGFNSGKSAKKCDDELNTTEVIENNEMRCKIAVRPVKVADWIVVDFICAN